MLVLSDLFEDSYDIRKVQEVLGHQDVKPTMVYTQVLSRGGLGARIPWTPCVTADGRLGGNHV